MAQSQHEDCVDTQDGWTLPSWYAVQTPRELFGTC